MTEDWDKINKKKRIEITEGQSLNQSFQIAFGDAKYTLGDDEFQRRVVEYMSIYNKLLKINKKLLELEK